ncbi:carbon-nitrogen hydrolase [Colletotrichum gloeosporioides Cg-14]|uniref:Carbon-nitrogen hydrolase n=1 Tax=Colletotrichum gloeosporioides (strain Cg-14) TaxID=1237896 RepID=T0M4Z6_COLGC|nr:carbon-nitrogen hydrolase [Colletotrichum gloeosporioides Cg-14]
MPQIRLATSSPATAPTTPLTLALIDRLARRASSHAADLLLLPEAFIGGYPRGADFGCKIGSRLPSGRDAFLDYFAKAADLGDTVGDAGAGAGSAWVNKTLPAQFPDSENRGYTRGDGSREELERIAAQTGVFLVVGLIEKAGGSLYCAVVYVCPRKGMLGKRRKVMPTATERLIWSQGSPATLKAVSTVIKGVRLNLAAAICWESYMPLLRQALYAQNINLYLAPTADGRDTWLPLMRTVACEGRCFVVSSNMAVRPPPASSTSAVEDAEVRDAEVYPARARRNSCLTEDGNEIALPDGTITAKSTTSTATSPSRRRRKSVIVEDGNEIVLSCDAEDNNNTNGVSTATKATTTNGTSKQQQPLKSEDWISRGGSCIVGPFGDVLAGPQWEDDEGIIYSDVDFEDCIRGRLDIDTAGSYSRNDSFKFSVEGLDLDPLPY